MHPLPSRLCAQYVIVIFFSPHNNHKRQVSDEDVIECKSGAVSQGHVVHSLNFASEQSLLPVDDKMPPLSLFLLFSTLHVLEDIHR